MTSLDLSQINLGALIRTISKATVDQAMAKVHTPTVLAGTVEHLDEDLDVTWIRMDGETITSDPTESANYELPGVVPAMRMGEANTGDRARVVFEAAAGASATRTSTENRIVLPFGAESGRRIVIDGDGGFIAFFDDDDTMVGLLDVETWAMGDIEPPGARATFDPVGGLRMRNTLDQLVSILDQNGYSLRDGATGQVMADLKAGSFRMADPTGNASIEFVTSSAGTIPQPAWRSAIEASPGSSLVAPAAPTFTTPADDIAISHVAAWKRVTNQAATMTPPATWTEQSDQNDQSGAGTLQTSVATLDPATGAAGTFTSSQSNWEHAVGTQVILKGGGAVSPSFRSISTSFTALAGSKVTVSINKPASVADTDALVVFVAMGVSGGFVPTGWDTPDGFEFLGANVSTSGSGATQSTLAVGAWLKRAGASEPASYSTTIQLPAGLKAIQGTMVAIQNPFLVPGGVQVRINNRPTRQLIAFNELAAASTTLCDFQGISQAYDNLELQIEAISDQNGAGAGTPARYRMRFNNDTGNNYFYQLTEFQDTTTTPTMSAGAATSRLLLGAVNGLNGSTSAAILAILGYCRPSGRRTLNGHGYWVTGALGANMRNGRYVGEYTGGAINRVTVDMDGTPNRFAIGSRAYLYAY